MGCTDGSWTPPNSPVSQKAPCPCLPSTSWSLLMMIPAYHGSGFSARNRQGSLLPTIEPRVGFSKKSNWEIQREPCQGHELSQRLGPMIWLQSEWNKLSFLPFTRCGILGNLLHFLTCKMDIIMPLTCLLEV